MQNLSTDLLRNVIDFLPIQDVMHLLQSNSDVYKIGVTWHYYWRKLCKCEHIDSETCEGDMDHFSKWFLIYHRYRCYKKGICEKCHKSTIIDSSTSSGEDDNRCSCHHLFNTTLLNMSSETAEDCCARPRKNSFSFEPNQGILVRLL